MVQATCTKLVKFGCVVFELREQQNKQTDTLITIRRTPPEGEVKSCAGPCKHPLLPSSE